MPPTLVSFRGRLAIVLALLASLGVGGFFAIKALDEGTKHEWICTAMGCTSAIGVDMHGVAKAFPGARSMNVCVDNHCYLAYPIEKLLGGSAYRPRQIYYEGPAIHGEGPYSVRVEVKDGRGRVLLRRETRGVRLSRRYPNGKGCGEPCFSAKLALNFVTDELERVLKMPPAQL